MAETTPDGTAVNPPVSTGTVTAQDAYNFALVSDVGKGDDPQFAANAPCGASSTLLGERFVIIPIAWRYLLPWQILPDPSAEQIRQLSAEVEARMRRGTLSEPLSAVFEQVRARIDEAVKNTLAD
jgi:hypothetical protein